MRIVSLLPSATEILFALGLGKQVVGVSHECDYPPEVRSLPILTECVFDSPRMTQSDIDSSVRDLAGKGKSLYRIKEKELASADPDLIITQDLCHVCAVTPDEVKRAVAHLARGPQLVMLNPTILDDVFNDMLSVARAAGITGDEVVGRLRSRVRRIAPASTLREKPSVGCLEWLDPLWRSGHWVPGMVELAGGREVFAQIGKPSRPIDWSEIQEKDPDVIIVMPCGFNISKTREEFAKVRDQHPWEELKAYRNQSLYIVDANSYFSRSGPRLVDGLELLAELLHPEYFANIAPLHSYIRLT